MSMNRTNAIASNKYNKEQGCNTTQAGSRKENEPRLLGSIVDEMLHGNSPLAIGYRQYITSKENAAEVEECGWNRNTDLSMDVKTFLREDRITKIGKDYPGVLRRNSDDHYSFVEIIPMISTAGKRNPHVFNGKYITVTRRDDGSYRPNFKPMKVDADFSIVAYAYGVAKELIKALKGLVKEGNGK